MFLPGITGHEGARRYFERALAGGRLSHAYLFIGPEGAGKRQFARQLAAALYCTAGSGCGTCTECVRIAHGNHPNVNFYSAPEGKQIIDIDTVRALCERTHYRASGIEVAVLEDADLLGEPAANALLKTLEEPPGSAIIILTAQSTGSLLSTIVSRCHRIYFTGKAREAAASSEAARTAAAVVAEPGFFAEQDPRKWLLEAFPDEETTRGAARVLLDFLVEEWRGKLAELDELPLDDALRRLEIFIDLRQDLDRSVNADLVLERAIRTIRRGG